MTCHLGHETCKPQRDVTAGDIVMFMGAPHLIAEIEPHGGPFDFTVGIARAADGWGITLCDHGCCEVAS